MRPFLLGEKHNAGYNFDQVVLINIVMDLKDTIANAVEEALKNAGTYNSKNKDFDLLDIDGASELTGYSKQTIYKLTCQRQIPFIKRPGGRKLFFSKKALESWILGKKI
jgi:excisionase family DNA binding protein